MWLVYNVLFFLGYILCLPRFIFRMLKRGGYGPGFMQRFGIYDEGVREAIGEGRIWIHAVSVGEMMVALKYLERLRTELPDRQFIISTTTSTGHAVARKNLKENDVLLYYPADFPWIIAKVLRTVRPSAVLLMETEIWPNMIRLARRASIPVFLLNGRLSESSFRGYRRIRLFVLAVLNKMNGLLVQTEDDRERYMALGVSPALIHAVGSAKFDGVASGENLSEPAAGVLKQAGYSADDLVLVGGSTWAGEEHVLFRVYQELKKTYSSLRLILVPRHAERAGGIRDELEGSGATVIRRSMMDASTQPHDVLLVDTTGELMSFYNAATVVFVGKSLTQHGGQNVIEPASLSKPVIVGPNMENFRAITNDFLRHNAMMSVSTPEELSRAVANLLEDVTLREGYGARAAELVRERGGAIAASIERITSVVSTSGSDDAGQK